MRRRYTRKRNAFDAIDGRPHVHRVQRTANGDTLTFTLGGTSFTATYVTAAPVGNRFTSLAQLQTLLNTAFNGQAVATLPGSRRIAARASF